MIFNRISGCVRHRTCDAGAMKTSNNKDARTAIRTGALLRVGTFLRAGNGFSPIVGIGRDCAGTGLRLKLKCGAQRLVRNDEPVVIRATRDTLLGRA